MDRLSQFLYLLAFDEGTARAELDSAQVEVTCITAANFINKMTMTAEEREDYKSVMEDGFGEGFDSALALRERAHVVESDSDL